MPDQHLLLEKLFLLVSVFLLIIGLTLLSLVSETLLPFFCGAIPYLIFSRQHFISCFRPRYCPIYHNPAMSYVAVIYAICVFVAGSGQFYNLLVFGNPLVTHDELLFYSLSVDNLTEVRWSSLAGLPLHLLIWRFFYMAFQSLGGVTCGVWLGILVNIIVLGVAVYIWLGVGEVFLLGPVQWRLFCILVAFNPLFWLFGAFYLRDNIIFLINALTVYLLIKFQRSVLWIMVGLFGVIILTFAMYWTRPQMAFLPSLTAVVYYLVYFLPRIISWLKDGVSGCRFVGMFNLVRAIFILGALFIIIFLALIIQKMVVEANGCYKVYGSAVFNQINSPAMSWVFSQSLPLRVFIGSASLLLTPVPVWSFLYSRADSYHIVKVFYWAVMLIVWPMFIVGSWTLLRNVFQIKFVWVFCLVFAWLMIFAVGISSCEIRHLGVFMPYILLVASYSAGQWRWPVLFRVAVCYYLLIFAVHIYVVCKFVR